MSVVTRQPDGWETVRSDRFRTVTIYQTLFGITRLIRQYSFEEWDSLHGPHDD